MILDPHISHPGARSYVLKLHRDARPDQGRWIGRVENLASGHRFDFASADELLGRLALDVARVLADARDPAACAQPPRG